MNKEMLSRIKYPLMAGVASTSLLVPEMLANECDDCKWFAALDRTYRMNNCYYDYQQNQDWGAYQDCVQNANDIYEWDVGTCPCC